MYALGSLRQELPAYEVLADPGGMPVDAARNWSSGYLPAVYQGTPFRATGVPVLNLASPSGVTPESRRGQLDFLAELNAAHLAHHSESSELAARTRNYELASKMQTAVPEVLDLSRETEETRRLGLDNPATADSNEHCQWRSVGYFCFVEVAKGPG